MDKIAKQVEELQKVFDEVFGVVQSKIPDPEATIIFNNLIEKISHDIEKKVSERIYKFVKKLSKLEKVNNEPFI